LQYPRFGAAFTRLRSPSRKEGIHRPGEKKAGQDCSPRCRAGNGPPL
jgi:hypothetical protein